MKLALPTLLLQNPHENPDSQWRFVRVTAKHGNIRQDVPPSQRAAGVPQAPDSGGAAEPFICVYVCIHRIHVYVYVCIYI